jgi:hypothetical protein
MRKLLFILICLLPLVSYAANKKTVEAFGEAEIKGNDIASAKIQATARAKWAAMEKAAGVKVKVESLVQNAVLVDEAIKSEVGGVVESYKIIDEGKDGNVYWNKIRATIVPQKALKAMSFVAKNTSVAILIPVIFPDGKVEETTSLTENIISQLIENGLEVADLAESGDNVAVRDIEKAMRRNDFMAMRNLAYKHLSGVILIGKVDTIATAREGKNVGYGVSLPFNIVTGQMTYRLIGEKNGRKVILASGHVSGRGQGATVEDATYNMMDNLNKNVSARLIGLVLEKVKGINNKPIEVVLSRNRDINKLLDLKHTLTYISWVLETKEQGMDTIMVKYPEKSLYLATAINSKGKYRVKKFNNYQIIVEENY